MSFFASYVYPKSTCGDADFFDDFGMDLLHLPMLQQFGGHANSEESLSAFGRVSPVLWLPGSNALDKENTEGFALVLEGGNVL